jgi:hypothetical protein
LRYGRLCLCHDQGVFRHLSQSHASQQGRTDESQEESQTHFSQHFSQLQFDTMIAKAAFRCNAAKLLQKIDTMSENNIYFNFREQLSGEG